MTWSADQLGAVDSADELEIAVRRAGGDLRGWVPIWVVRVDDQVFVRTWYRRPTGWFGHVLDTGRARVRVRGMEADVTVEDVGVGSSELRADVDAAYRHKYGRYGVTTVDRMVSDSAARATLRLTPE
ncbi:DUF2255 family protein [Gordonia hankookensis]|uniref:DUF2255 family protein n=1 Tax=Gordonia hankookensis TaxID=589403 RepID=A0ABR7WK16_9ACTN|nr:DUF2255 family protein [Gordonia hankookensis]MBD1322107.1 DUF2255 family protein [Gordonia hankookensis]